MATPARTVPAVVAEAAALGCGGAVVFAAGFAEAGGAGRQARLLAAAGSAGADGGRLPVVGPNSNGLVAVAARAPLWGDAVVLPAEAGPTALITQSGNIGVVALAHRGGLGLHSVVSLGNATVVDAATALHHLAGAPGVRVVAAYLEADGDGALLARALARCVERDVRVVVLKAGRSPAGRVAGGAHTASLSGDHAVFAALLDEAGAVLVTTPHELLETARALAAGRRAAGRLAVVTCSGGDAAVAADLAADAGVALARWTPSTFTTLATVLPATATAANPLDHTNAVWADPAALARIGAAVAADPGVGHVMYVQDEPPTLPASDALEWRATRDGVLDGAAAAGVPALLVATTPGQEPEGAVGGLRPALLAVRALSRPAPDPGRLRAVADAAARTARRAAGPPAAGRWLAEHEAARLLAAAGVAVPEQEVADDAAAAAVVAARLGGRLAVKLSAPGLLHASEVGGVAVDVPAQEVGGVASRLLARPGAPQGARVLVARMAPPGVEVLVAARVDGVVPTLVVGLGGIWAETLADVVTLPLPATADDVVTAVARLRGAALLLGGRGHAGADVRALATLAARVGSLLLETESLGAVELNPVLVAASGAVAVDALALWTAAEPPT